ncbi:MAG TPA: diphosphate--fructose-6-phosphate 1-phosphotransferase [Dissulfurispiraceae bacterium]|nr:diphosphate--fructose-6-phosphate 1-phosphotransferase [Dissulfurispiraceae bacterium]
MAKKELVGIIVGGGPAPGINGVISSATIEAINEGRDVVGIVGGFKPLFDGNAQCAIPLTITEVSRLHTEGGSILRTSRDYPDKAREKFKVLMATLKKMGIRHLVTIGGEGTLFMANWIEKEGRGSINVAHVPKTIDNDIPLPGGVSTFGYQTARHVGVYVVSNIMEDAKTTGRWYFITTMGRHAGHLALGIGKAAGATLSLIPEEFKADKIPLRAIGDVLAGSIIKRLAMGKDHGVAILAEGLTDKLDHEELRQYETCQVDETGRLRLSEILLGRILKTFVGQTLEAMGIKMTIVDKNVGYELRAAHPIPFDVEYTRNLGYGAIRFLLRGGSGAVIVVEEGHMRPLPFVEMMDYSTGRVKVRTVDTNSINYEVARKYMIRLEKTDFEDKQLANLAKTAKMSPEEFRNRFGSVL